MVYDYASDPERMASYAVLLDFYGTNCQPCAQIAKLLPKWAEQTGTTVLKVNVEDAPELAQSFNVRKVPTFVYLKEGLEVDRIVGVPRLVDLTEMVTKE